VPIFISHGHAKTSPFLAADAVSQHVESFLVVLRSSILIDPQPIHPRKVRLLERMQRLLVRCRPSQLVLVYTHGRLLRIASATHTQLESESAGSVIL
jgi:hypothetical protein